MNQNLIGCSYVKWTGKKGNPYMKRMKTGLFVLTTSKPPTVDVVREAVGVLDASSPGQNVYVRSFTVLPVTSIPFGVPSIVENTVTKHIPVETTEYVRA